MRSLIEIKLRFKLLTLAHHWLQLLQLIQEDLVDVPIPPVQTTGTATITHINNTMEFNKAC